MLNIINNITYIFYKTYLSPLPKPYLWTAPLKTPTTWRLAVSFRSCLDIAHGGKKGISVVNHGKSPRKTSCKKHWIICVYIYIYIYVHASFCQVSSDWGIGVGNQTPKQQSFQSTSKHQPTMMYGLYPWLQGLALLSIPISINLTEFVKRLLIDFLWAHTTYTAYNIQYIVDC